MWKFFNGIVNHITYPPCEFYNFSLVGGYNSVIIIGSYLSSTLALQFIIYH